MGEIADDIVDGYICQFCMQPLELGPDGTPCGYPRSCAECLETEEELEEGDGGDEDE